MHCSECGKPVTTSMRFCTNCGTKTEKAGFGANQDRRGQTGTNNARTRHYKMKKKAYAKTVDGLQSWLKDQYFEVQLLDAAGGKQMIQAKKSGDWRKFVGLATATNIVLSHKDGKLTVEVGHGEWLDKLAGGAIGYLINPVFLVTTGFGAFEQWQMPDRIFAQINNYASA